MTGMSGLGGSASRPRESRSFGGHMLAPGSMRTVKAGDCCGVGVTRLLYEDGLFRWESSNCSARRNWPLCGPY